MNQVLFTVYALRIRHGDMSYLAVYVPEVWFELADGRAFTASIKPSRPGASRVRR